jgi:hypothetical protein
MGALLERTSNRVRGPEMNRPELKGKRSQGLGSPPGPGARLLGPTATVLGVFVVCNDALNHFGGCFTHPTPHLGLTMLGEVIYVGLSDTSKLYGIWFTFVFTHDSYS